MCRKANRKSQKVCPLYKNWRKMYQVHLGLLWPNCLDSLINLLLISWCYNTIPFMREYYYYQTSRGQVDRTGSRHITCITIASLCCPIQVLRFRNVERQANELLVTMGGNLSPKSRQFFDGDFSAECQCTNSPQPILVWRSNKIVNGKQCKPGSDAAECGPLSGSPLFANSVSILL